MRAEGCGTRFPYPHLNPQSALLILCFFLTGRGAAADMSVVLWSTEYRRSVKWDALESIHQSRVRQVQAEPDRAFLLVSEPSPTFTHGRFVSGRTDCLWDEARREKEGVEIREVGRGGRWTYHGPGQIVLYPVFPLERLGKGRRAVLHYTGLLREAILETLRSWTIAAKPGDRPFGVYVDEKKIASFGIAIDEGVTSHGVAVYFSDQSHFLAGINPCGALCAPSTSLAENDFSGSWETAANAFADAVKKSLNRA